uniref:Uncharacterized protein n=1 Tax=Anguilla anguilla TaxID=7936 RepID=A0A0E9WNC5_ANGAN
MNTKSHWCKILSFVSIFSSVLYAIFFLNTYDRGKLPNFAFVAKIFSV